MQTAELVAEQLGFEGVIEVLPSLMPIGPIEASAEAIREQSRSVAVVGHEPSISALAGLLTGQGHFPPLRKAQVVCVHGDRAVWTIDPDRLDPVSL